MDLKDLPPMRDAELSADEVNALFGDIGAMGSEILLMQRKSTARRATAAKLDSQTELEVAKMALLSGKIQRVQIRYRWNKSLWIDTLSMVNRNFRLVRIKRA